MGAGASAAGKDRSVAVREVLSAEQEKPKDAADVDTPRGESAKEEVRRLRGLLAECSADLDLLTRAAMGDSPSLQEYFRRVFSKWDKDGSGCLSREEFWSMMDELKLNLAPSELSELQRLTDTDADGNIQLEEFVLAAPKFFADAASQSEPNPERDWMQLEADNGTPFYYNKRTGVSQWDPPAEYVAAVDEAAEELETKMSPDMKDYLTQLFEHADADGSGVLSIEEFWGLLQNSLNLGLTEEKLEQLRSKSDVDRDGSVRWQEFVLIADGLIRAIHENVDEAECWHEQKDQEGNTYYLNSKTGTSQWNKPEGYKGADVA